MNENPILGGGKDRKVEIEPMSHKETVKMATLTNKIVNVKSYA